MDDLPAHQRAMQLGGSGFSEQASECTRAYASNWIPASYARHFEGDGRRHSRVAVNGLRSHHYGNLLKAAGLPPF